MAGDYKNILALIFAVFFLIFLAGFQIAFLNRFSWGINIFLILILFLILNKNIHSAIFFAWVGGLLIDTVSFSVFGVTSLIFLILAFFLIIFQKTALVTVKTEGVFITSVLAVIFYHFLNWVINNMLAVGQEKFSFYFFNSAIAAELLMSAALVMIIFKYKVEKNV